MKVKQLVALLLKKDQEAEVFQSSDAEGNSIEPVADVSDDGEGKVVIWP